MCVLGRAAPQGSPFTAVDGASPPPLAIAAPAAPGAGQKPKLPAGQQGRAAPRLPPCPPQPLYPFLWAPQAPTKARHAEEEHLEALFQPFTIVIIITTSNQEMLLRRQSYSPRRRVTQGRSNPLRIQAVAGGALPPAPSPRPHPHARPPPAPARCSLPRCPPRYRYRWCHSRAAPRRRCLC